MDQLDIFTALAEIEDAASPLCPHAVGVRVQTGGWTLEHDPDSPYYHMWVHGHPNCRRPAHLTRQEI